MRVGWCRGDATDDASPSSSSLRVQTQWYPNRGDYSGVLSKFLGAWDVTKKRQKEMLDFCPLPQEKDKK